MLRPEQSSKYMHQGAERPFVLFASKTQKSLLNVDGAEKAVNAKTIAGKGRHSSFEIFPWKA